MSCGGTLPQPRLHPATAAACFSMAEDVVRIRQAALEGEGKGGLSCCYSTCASLHISPTGTNSCSDASPTQPGHHHGSQRTWFAVGQWGRGLSDLGSVLRGGHDDIGEDAVRGADLDGLAVGAPLQLALIHVRRKAPLPEDDACRQMCKEQLVKCREQFRRRCSGRQCLSWAVRREWLGMLLVSS